jgi:membrane protein
MNKVRSPDSSAAAPLVMAWIIKQTIKECLEDDTPQLGAALAYYTLFSLAPLTLIALAIIGFFSRSDPGQAWSKVVEQLGYFLDQSAIDIIQNIAKSAAAPNKGALATVSGLVLAVVGASGMFAQLQSALNTIWKVNAGNASSFRLFLGRRLVSFAMVAATLLLLLLSLVGEGMLEGLTKYAQASIPGGIGLARVIYFTFDYSIVTLMFAIIFKVLPDLHISWRDVFLGAAATAAFFLLGKWLLGNYLTSGAPASAYGAASTLVTLLLWIYYSSQIFLFGAQLTQVWAKRKTPPSGASAK